MRSTSDPATRAALVALAQEPHARTGDLGPVFDAAGSDLGEHEIRHGLAGLAHHHLLQLGERRPALEITLAKARRTAWSRHAVISADLAVVASALSALPSPWTVIRGPVLADFAYGAPNLRTYADLDVLVSPAARDPAIMVDCERQ